MKNFGLKLERKTTLPIDHLRDLGIDERAILSYILR
jgi:hypothetical protein